MHNLVRIVLAVLMSVFVAGAANAQPIDEVKGKELAGEAMGHYREGEFEQALELFKQAKAIYPAGQVLRMTGYTLVAMERWLEAAEAIEEALVAKYKPLLPRDAEHAEDNLKEALSHIVQVEVVSNVAGATVSVNGGPNEQLPTKLKLEPGTHTFEVSADEHDSAEAEKDLEAGQKVTIELDPTPLDSGDSEPIVPPPPKPEPEPDEADEGGYGWFPGQGAVGLTMGGVGLALGVAGLVTGVYGLNLESAVQENIDAHNQNFDPSCTQNSELCRNDIALINADGESAASARDTGMALGLAGAGLFTVGLILFLFSDDGPLAPDDGADTAIACTPFGCAGSF